MIVTTSGAGRAATSGRDREPAEVAATVEFKISADLVGQAEGAAAVKPPPADPQDEDAQRSRAEGMAADR